ncbi:MAG: helix-turn-helix transcriptional regulator [Bacteroidetes bacterium]|nr:helix-turn-helix transcriptional regulator [Bacteroidota bacterium]
MKSRTGIAASGPFGCHKDRVALPFCHSTLKAEKPKVFRYPPELNTLGDHIRARRLERGLFQKDVAQLVGVCTETVTNWEKNRSSPDLRVLPKVLEYLGYDPRMADESIGGRLVRSRQARGLSQRGVAHILGVDPSTLSKWELGTREPQGRYLQRVRLFLDSP